MDITLVFPGRRDVAYTLPEESSYKALAAFICEEFDVRVALQDRIVLTANDATVTDDADLRLLSSGDTVTVAVDLRAKAGTLPFHELLQSRWFDDAGVARLVREGNDVNAADVQGVTALHLARSAECVAALVRHGATVDAKDSEGRTPLHAAAGTGAVEGVATLLSLGAAVNACDYTGRTALHHAAAGPACMVSALLGSGADAGARDVTGRVAMHYAAGYNNEDVVRVLADHDQEQVNAATESGWTPLHEASLDYGQPPRVVVELLKSYGAVARATRRGMSPDLVYALTKRR